jgi:hypothetical protein
MLPVEKLQLSYNEFCEEISNYQRPEEFLTMPLLHDAIDGEDAPVAPNDGYTYQIDDDLLDQEDGVVESKCPVRPEGDPDAGLRYYCAPGFEDELSHTLDAHFDKLEKPGLKRRLSISLADQYRELERAQAEARVSNTSPIGVDFGAILKRPISPINEVVEEEEAMESATIDEEVEKSTALVSERESRLHSVRRHVALRKAKDRRRSKSQSAAKRGRGKSRPRRQ